MRFRRTRPIAVTLVAVLVAAVVAACGGSTPSATSAAASTATTPAPAAAPGGAAFAARRAQLAACLHKQGVTLPTRGFGARRFGATGATGPFRRFGATGAPGARRIFGATGAPGVPGGGFPGAGAFASANPKFAAALAKCGGFGGGFGAGRRFGATGSAGVSNPQYRAAVISYAACMKTHGVTLPKPNFSGVGFVFGTSVNRTTSAFVAANATCQGVLSTVAPSGGA